MMTDGCCLFYKILLNQLYVCNYLFVLVFYFLILREKPTTEYQWHCSVRVKIGGRWCLCFKKERKVEYH